jgi:putative phage-type endonuclease
LLPEATFNALKEKIMATTMRQVIFEEQSAHWHTWRANGIGGSDAPIIAADAGLCRPAPWMKKVEDLWKIKTGRVSGITASTWATRRGVKAEPLARKAYECTTGILLSPIYGEMTEMPFIRSSFDGVDFEGNVIGEAKLGSAHVHALARDNEVVEYYKPQLAHQALTAWGMPEEWLPEHTISFISYDPVACEMLHVTKPAFEYRKLAEDLLIAEQAFWNKVQQDAEPCGPEWRQAADAFLMVRAQLDMLEKKEDEAKARLIALLGDEERMSGAGVSVAREVRKGSIDYSKLVLDHTKLTKAEIEDYRKKDSSSIVVRAAKQTIN